MTRIIRRIVTNLDDTIANKADDIEFVKDGDKNENDDEDRDSSAEKDEVKDDENDDERFQGTEVYTISPQPNAMTHLSNSSDLDSDLI